LNPVEPGNHLSILLSLWLGQWRDYRLSTGGFELKEVVEPARGFMPLDGTLFDD
jgi:hypothetical protein